MTLADVSVSWVPAVMAAAASALLAGAWRALAMRQGWMDVPVQRSSHRQPTPRGGGVGIALVLLAWVLASGGSPVVVAAMVLSLAGAALVGLVDDLRGLRPMTKLVGQAVAAVPLALLGGEVSGGSLPSVAGVLAVAASGALLVFFVNAWNFMDGINGIAALSALAVGAVAAVFATGDPVVGLGIGLAAACAGFLPWNLPRARLFMGDAGSHVLGMAVGGLVILAAREGPVTAVWSVLAAGLPFIVDVLGTLARRALDREPLASAHRRHLYQLMVRCGYSHARVALAFGLAAAILGTGVAMVERNVEGAGPVAFAAAAVLVAGAWAATRAVVAPRVLDGGRA